MKRILFKNTRPRSDKVTRVLIGKYRQPSLTAEVGVKPTKNSPTREQKSEEVPWTRTNSSDGLPTRRPGRIKANKTDTKWPSDETLKQVI